MKRNSKELLQTVAYFAGQKLPFDEGVVSSMPLSDTVSTVVVDKTMHSHEKPQDLYCLGVPGEAFVVRSWDDISVTCNTLHCQGMIQVFRTLIDENPKLWTDEFKKELYDIARKMVELEDAFVSLCFQMGPLEGLTETEVRLYVRSLADRRLLQLGLKPNFGVKNNPLPWVDWMVSGVEHANFFETRSTEYSKGGVEGWDDAF